jgi:16S rRNA (guanine527-N7)-methyltransferase
MDSLQAHFPKLSSHQCAQLNAFVLEIKEWNKKINVISRKDEEAVVNHHLLPSLALASILPLKPEETVLDVGSGGGFPAIPLAICFPETQFTLVDSIGKKIKVIEAITESLQLTNLRPINIRVENIKETFNYVTGRAVTALPRFLEWVQPRLRKPKKDAKHGVYYLKGGPLEPELSELNLYPRACYPLSEILTGTFYEDKYIAYFATSDIHPVFCKKPHKR